ncbi:MAG: nitroreductase family protein [Syntrophomonadaceae bacterium]|jgi:nitroreductase|nr:nitroreductase family protein [Syntrophomonadaceae bacterium]
MDAIKAIEKRKSIRSYVSKQVEADKINILARAANSAPKAGGFHISVITNTRVLIDIDEKALTAMKNSGNDFLTQRANTPGYRPLYGASALFVISAEKGPYAQATASCSATAVTIAATALNLGSCYMVSPILALTADSGLSAKIGVPEGYTPICAVALGYTESEDAFSTPREAADNINYCE